MSNTRHNSQKSTTLSKYASFIVFLMQELQTLEEGGQWAARDLQIQSLLMDRIVDTVGWLAAHVAWALRHDKEEDIADKVADAVHNHKEDTAVGDIVHVLAGASNPDSRNVALAASPIQVCSLQTQKKTPLGRREQEHPFFEDPLMDRKPFPAEVVEEY